MKTFLISLLAVMVTAITLLPDTADARRFGGGKSFGRQYSAPRQASPPRQTQQPAGNRQQAVGQQGARSSGASRWLGPLAGLAAGGLLASMLFGDGFEGFQIMDFLLIAGLIFGGVMLFKMLRRRTQTPALSRAGAGPGPESSAGPDAGAADYGRSPTKPLGNIFGGGGDARSASPTDGAEASDAPAWFDAAGFIDGSKNHFIGLQAAWDKADFSAMREYTSAEIFDQLKRERESMGTAPNYTEVVTLNAQFLGTRREDDQVVASVRFSGLIREEETGTANTLDETWHVAHPWGSAQGDWVIVGIQQAG